MQGHRWARQLHEALLGAPKPGRVLSRLGRSDTDLSFEGQCGTPRKSRYCIYNGATLSPSRPLSCPPLCESPPALGRQIIKKMELSEHTLRRKKTD